MKSYEWHEVDGVIRGHPSLVGCPFCGSPAGSRCAKKKHGVFHQDRVVAYFEERDRLNAVALMKTRNPDWGSF